MKTLDLREKNRADVGAVKSERRRLWILQRNMRIETSRVASVLYEVARIIQNFPYTSTYSRKKEYLSKAADAACEKLLRFGIFGGRRCLEKNLWISGSDTY